MISLCRNNPGGFYASKVIVPSTKKEIRLVGWINKYAFQWETVVSCSTSINFFMHCASENLSLSGIAL